MQLQVEWLSNLTTLWTYSIGEAYVSGVEFRQKIYLSDGQVDLQNHLSVMKSTCPTQENHKIKRLFNVAP